MKKILVLVFISFLTLGCFVSAKEPGNFFSKKHSVRDSGYLSGQNIPTSGMHSGLDTKLSSGSSTPLLSGTKISGKKPLKTGLCITGDQLVIRDQLSFKAQKAAESLFSLLQVAGKLSYPTETLSRLAEDLEYLSSQIKKDCSPRDFKLHRDQIKARLVLLKEEIARIKQYLLRLRNR